MIWLKFSTRKVSLAVILVLILAGGLFSPPAVNAQSQRRPSLTEKIRRLFFGTRPRGTPKGRKRGGAVRGRCRYVDQQKTLIALVPATAEGTPFVEQTIAERPTFWFYVPYLSSSRLNAEFALLNEKDELIYSAIFPLNQQPGIVSLQLPKNLPSLKERNNYHWVFYAICNPQNRAADAVVDGWVERVPVSSTLSSQLRATSALERVSTYVDANLWYETLTTLAELQRSDPEDKQVKAEWARMLKLVGLPKRTPQTWTTYSLPNSAEDSRGN